MCRSLLVFDDGKDADVEALQSRFANKTKWDGLVDDDDDEKLYNISTPPPEPQLLAEGDDNLAIKVNADERAPTLPEEYEKSEAINYLDAYAAAISEADHYQAYLCHNCQEKLARLSRPQSAAIRPSKKREKANLFRTRKVLGSMIGTLKQNKKKSAMRFVCSCRHAAGFTKIHVMGYDAVFDDTDADQ